MATPTPTTSGSKGTGSGPQNAATPQSLPHLAAFSSPAPRSVPSPAAQRGQHAGKSPFNASTHPPSTGTITAHNHPTGGSSASASRLLGSSPAGAALNTDSPAAMALSMSLSGFDGAGGLGMAFSMSNISGMIMGGTLSAKGRADDEERRKRLERVVELLKSRPGRISPEGVELLAKRSGLDTMNEINKRDGTTDVTIAGNSLVVEIKFGQSGLVKRVSVDLATTTEAVNKSYEGASGILQDTLTVPSRFDSITATLAKFSANLDQLGRMDKLNKLNTGFNCFEAVAGVYTSLRRLYEYEKATAVALMGTATSDVEERAAREVLCKRSGRPAMNERDNIGLRIDYWMKRRHALSIHKARTRPAPEKDKDAMDVDTTEKQSDDATKEVLSLFIECEASSPALPELQYPAARISNNWVGEPIEQPADETAGRYLSRINWQEPLETLLAEPNTTQADELQMSSHPLGKKPDVRFVAKLDPPLVIPYQVAISILQAVEATVPEHFSLQPRTYMGLLLQPHAAEDLSTVVVGEMEKLRCNRSLMIPLEEQGDLIHENGLFVFLAKLEDAPNLLGVQLEQIPFYHPRQIIELLPTLRQYALLNTLLSTSFPKPRAPDKPYTNGGATASTTRSLDFYHHPAPQPRLSVSYGTVRRAKDGMPVGDTLDAMLVELDAGAEADAPGALEFGVLPNAEVHITTQDVVPTDPSKLESATQRTGAQVEPKANARLAKALSITEDLDLCVEWLARNKDKLVQ